MTMVTLHKQTPWQEHAKRINAAWQKGVESIIETGQRLIEAKDELEHGSFESMVQLKLLFAPSTARALMAIAKHPVLSNRQHAGVLPPAWGTLAELARLPADLLASKIKDGTITPKLERKNVRALLPESSTKSAVGSSPCNAESEDDHTRMTYCAATEDDSVESVRNRLRCESQVRIGRLLDRNRTGELIEHTLDAAKRIKVEQAVAAMTIDEIDRAIRKGNDLAEWLDATLGTLRRKGRDRAERET
jgi:hypothetical protein